MSHSKVTGCVSVPLVLLTSGTFGGAASLLNGSTAERTLLLTCLSFLLSFVSYIFKECCLTVCCSKDAACGCCECGDPEDSEEQEPLRSVNWDGQNTPTRCCSMDDERVSNVYYLSIFQMIAAVAVLVEDIAILFVFNNLSSFIKNITHSHNDSVDGIASLSVYSHSVLFWEVILLSVSMVSLVAFIIIICCLFLCSDTVVVSRVGVVIVLVMVVPLSVFAVPLGTFVNIFLFEFPVIWRLLVLPGRVVFLGLALMAIGNCMCCYPFRIGRVSTRANSSHTCKILITFFAITVKVWTISSSFATFFLVAYNHQPSIKISYLSFTLLYVFSAVIGVLSSIFTLQCNVEKCCLLCSETAKLRLCSSVGFLIETCATVGLIALNILLLYYVK